MSARGAHGGQTSPRPRNPAQALALWEKAHYPFRSYPQGPCRTVVFPGCGLTSQFPRTTDALARLAADHGAATVFDCCGASLADWGRTRAAERVADGLRRRLERLGCTRLVAACPTCLARLDGLLGIPCISVYEQLAAWGVRAGEGDAGEGSGEPSALFVPCPDRRDRALEQQIRALGGLDGATALAGVPCCGLRASCAARDTAFSCAQGRRVLDAAQGRPLVTYCASCAGQFARLGYAGPVRHALSGLLGVDEAPDAARALANRARRALPRGGAATLPEEPPCPR